MASVNDKVTDTRNAARPVTASVSSPRAAGGTTLSCDSLTGWPTASKVHFVTYTVDSNNNPVVGSQLDCIGIVSGSTIGSFDVIDGTDAGNSIGDKVEMLPTAAWGQDLADALTNEHSRTGEHVGVTNTGGMTTDTLTVSSGTTLPPGDIGTADIASAAVTADKLSTGAGAAYVATSETTASTSYADLATTSDTVTVTIGANGLALVSVGGTLSNDTSNFLSYMGFAISGASTVAAADSYSVSWRHSTANFAANVGRTFLVTGLTPGSTTFKAKYKVQSNTGTFVDRRISVVPL